MTNTASKISDLPISAADIDAAARVIAPYAVRTPLLPSPALDALTGGRIFVKPEVLQRTGSFKFRGAFNKLSSIPDAERGRGVVAFSSGNHAQGVAAAAQILGMKATIVMPSDAPAMKVARTRGYGAEVVLYDRDKEDREAIARKISGDSGATVVPPYDDVFVMAGQGTVGREIAEDLAALAVVPDVISAQASGGGLIGGIAVAVKARFADASIIVAEPAGYHDHELSLKAGKPVAHGNHGRTICDALMAQQPGDLTFAVNKHLLAGAVSATDQDVMEAMAFAFSDLKLVVEPGGAVALAALLKGKIDARGKTVVIVLSGGNVDAELYSKVISA